MDNAKEPTQHSKETLSATRDFILDISVMPLSEEGKIRLKNMVTAFNQKVPESERLDIATLIKE
ncbi:hypothetical protein ACFL1E_02890 [Candidatus Omnitrophota bacterium]